MYNVNIYITILYKLLYPIFYAKFVYALIPSVTMFSIQYTVHKIPWYTLLNLLHLTYFTQVP